MNSTFLFPGTSSSIVQVAMALFIIFLVTLNVKINCARNYETLFSCVTVMPKILVIPFFWTRCICSEWLNNL